MEQYKFCKICGNRFYKNYNYSKNYWSKQIYCGFKCYGISKRGKPTWMKGRTASAEHREKLSKSHIGIQAGERHPQWKGGISKDKDYYRKKQKIYYREHPERNRIYAQQRTARTKGGGKLTIKTIQQVYEDNIKQYGTLTCYLCLKPIEFGKDTLEHKIPLSRGGINEKVNLAIACFKCNVSKGIKTEEEYFNWLNKLDIKF